MRITRCLLPVVVCAASVAGLLALVHTAAIAADHCPQRPLPPSLQEVCRACPTVVDPVVCPVVCAGGIQQRTFSNQCFANCSGFIIRGECTKTGT